MKNIILSTDSYKVSHYKQYPEGAEYISSYIEARGSDDPDFDSVMTVGIQAFINEYLMTPITRNDIKEAEEILTAHGYEFNKQDWLNILYDHNGYMPVEITALPEGTIVPLSIPLVQIRNTDPRFPWLTSYLETALLRAIWYPSTVATNSRAIRNVLKAYANKSMNVPNIDFKLYDNRVDFKLHDFGARGVSSSESAAIGGAAHLMTGALGTDTVESLLYLRRNYGANMPGFSIPAAEHSTITTWGDKGEVEAFRNNIKQFDGEGKIFAVVSDSYSIDNAIDNIWGDELYDEVRNLKGTLVIRPDSGDPLTEPGRIIMKLMKIFGYEYNNKGYKVLPNYVRVIQGDGITKDSIKEIIKDLDKRQISLDNIAFGMGGGMLQLVNRDTLKFAMKANSITINGETRDVYKMPQTDTSKGSKAGLQAVIKDGSTGKFKSVKAPLNCPEPYGYLQIVYRNGEAFNKTTLDEIRERANEESSL